MPHPERLRLVLASASPARLATLRAAGVDPVVVVSRVDEEALLAGLRRGTSDPAAHVLALARAKAEEVAARLQPGPLLVLGCDSMLEIDGVVVGKPGTVAAAVERWRQMRGRGGRLHTGHWLVDLRGSPGGERRGIGRTSTTLVHFADLTDEEIDAYVGTGEPLQVAGGFTIDGLGGPYVTAVVGDHHGVVGVSLPLVRELLARLGIPIHRLWTARALSPETNTPVGPVGESTNRDGPSGSILW